MGQGLNGREIRETDRFGKNGRKEPGVYSLAVPVCLRTGNPCQYKEAEERDRDGLRVHPQEQRPQGEHSRGPDGARVRAPDCAGQGGEQVWPDLLAVQV